MKRQLLAAALDRTRLRGPAGRLLRWRGVLGLAYHRIGAPAGWPFDRELWSASAEAFEGHVRFLKSRFDVVSPADLPEILRRGKGRHVLITFDDGYRDNYEVAYPVLRSHGLPATFFITTGFIDAPRLPWWDEIAWMMRASRLDRLILPSWLEAPVPFDEPDRDGAIRVVLHHYETIPGDRAEGYLDDLGAALETGRPPVEQGRPFWMTWEMIRGLKAGGMTIGGHTVSHPVLAQVPPERQWDEIHHCARRLAEELDGQPMLAFSYPVGSRESFDDRTRALLRRAGVRYAFSYYKGRHRRFGDWDDLDIRRLGVDAYISPELFRAMVELPWPFLPSPAARDGSGPGGPR